MSIFSFLNPHPRNELSAYIDGELASARAARVEAHLAGCGACRAEVEALRRTRAALQSLPEAVAPPRSFTLTPQMATRPERPALPRPSGMGLSQGLRLASAGLAVALVAVVLADTSGMDNGDRSGGDDSGPGAEINYQAADSFAGDGDGAAPTAGEDGGEKVVVDQPTPLPMATATPAPGATGALGFGMGGGEGPEGEGLTPAPLPATGADDDEGVTRDLDAAGDVTDTFEDSGEPEEAAPVTVSDSGSDGDGVDVVLMLEIVLGAAIVLALGGSFFAPRFIRRG